MLGTNAGVRFKTVSRFMKEEKKRIVEKSLGTGKEILSLEKHIRQQLINQSPEEYIRDVSAQSCEVFPLDLARKIPNY